MFPLARPSTAPRLGPGYRSVLSAAADGGCGGGGSLVEGGVGMVSRKKLRRGRAAKGAFGTSTARTTFADDAAAACIREHEVRPPPRIPTEEERAEATLRAVALDHTLAISEAGRAAARKERRLANANLKVRDVDQLPFGLGGLFTLGQLEDRKNAKLDQRGPAVKPQHSFARKPDPAADYRNFASAVIGAPIVKFHRPSANLGPESDDER